MVDNLTSKQRNRCMSRVRNKNTSLELCIRKRLFEKGYRYRVNYKLYGNPDIIFTRVKLAIFIDSCFWHGCPKHGTTPKTNTDFWQIKIDKNRDRDNEVTTYLKSIGWHVLRIWEHDIKKSIEDCVCLIINTYQSLILRG
jgi:DNA mismatch endonuclease (patch repair protein)